MSINSSFNPSYHAGWPLLAPARSYKDPELRAKAEAVAGAPMGSQEPSVMAIYEL
jgi:hypothetical protein